MLLRFAQWLDKKEFLNYRLWEFSLRNLFRFFPYHFIFKVLFFHPYKALRGIIKYQKLVKNSNGEPLTGTTKLENIFLNLNTSRIDSSQLLISPGFCMKPYDEVKSSSTCPVGHFNHRCLVLEKSALSLKDQKHWQQPCNDCPLGTLAQLSAKIKANFYIMTSAYDITNDLFLPAIKNKTANLGIFLLCPYSTEAFTWGLAISGIDGFLITFYKGDCLNHEDFTKADVGIKEKQTIIEHAELDNLKTEVSKISQTKAEKVENHIHYIFKNNVYTIKNHAQY